MTTSQKLFEKYCFDSGIKYVPIQTGTAKTPDYELTIDGQLIFVEVSEIDRIKDNPNSDGVIDPPGYTPGDPVRSKIKKKLHQIKERTRGIYPGLLVLFDHGFIGGYLDPYDIRVAMYGLEQIHVKVPVDPSARPYFTGMSYGPKRKMTEDDNTSISAIGVLSTPGPNEIILDIYHNKFAAVQLDPKLLAKYSIRQFKLEDGAKGKTAKWKEWAIQNN